ncbi:aliphatic sulfonate ABC transporter substrate-binding protein [Trichocoleus sp. FACHB-591]|uniref:aliphatic sulfonate ABC transporter substrate-binding protein n=1 Tax=Trichocoleus sp. FACHB-591 TaxID=2692872 RepID=UPI0016860BB1|nr:aliphatic sulfonate ABC transporter substrate-binding protein [Trichocoleus sp. FACHB-591]
MWSLNKTFSAWQRSKITRRSALFCIGYSLALSTSLASCTAPSDNAAQSQGTSANVSTASNSGGGKQEFRVVRSKQLSSLAVLEQQGTLDKALEPLGFTVKWTEFAAGPQQLEALNAGSLDIAHTAESPAIFAQAAGAPLVYVATTHTNGKPVALLVPKDSPVKSVADLKGKRIAFQKASIGHYLLVKALEQAGLTLNDVESVFLPPPEANVAFSQGKVDAWFIWDPYITRAEQSGAGRILIDGENLRDTRNFYTTSRKFYQAHPEVIKVFLEELEKTEDWSRNHPKEMAQLLAPVTQLDPATLEIMHGKYNYGLQPITEAVITKQEEVAGLWYSLKLIPKQVNVRDGFLTPEEYAKFTPQAVLAKQ